jgi:hypothetical protein
VHTEKIYQSAAFAMLATGMKDREAFTIIMVLMMYGLFDVFEAFCKEKNDD